ncbi:MAG: PipA/GogA/GtgA family type III secretion system effector [Janthinobacterium lividum]
MTAPNRAMGRPRTVWTHDLLREAGNLTQTVWHEARPALGDDRWTSAGIAAWWGLRYSLDTHEAASMLHRARSLAYGAFAASEPERAGWAQLNTVERMMLNAWIQTRTALESIAHTTPSAQAARALLMQVAERECRGGTKPATPDTLYLRVTADNLALRYDIDAIRRQYGALWNPSLALKMTAYFRDMVLPRVESLAAIDALPAAVQRALDEAALLFFTIQDNARQAWSTASSQGRASRATLRRAFIALLPEEEQNQVLLDRLFRPTNVPARIYHDGVTLRNALGRTFDDLLNSEELRDLPGMADVTPARRQKLLTRKFAQWYVSTRYPFGSVRHAIATTVERIANLHGTPLPEDLDTDTGLLNALKDARRVWAEADDGPVSPDLLLAGQLAAHNQVRLETTDSLRQWFEHTIATPFRRASEQMRAAGVNGIGPLEWLMHNMQEARAFEHRSLSSCMPREYEWAIDRVRQEKERIAGDTKRYQFVDLPPNEPFVRATEAEPHYDAIRAIFYERAFRDVDPAALRHEILVGNTWQERGQASLAYANERLLATFNLAPMLNLAAIAEDTLAAAGLNTSEIHAIRRIEIQGSNDELREPVTGSFIDAFLKVCRQVSRAQHFFLPSGQAIRPMTVVEPAIDAFNAGLASDSWIRLAALETFRRDGIAPSSRTLQSAIDEKVREHCIPSITAVMLSQIFDIRNLVPLYGSSQAIYQGLTEKRYYQVLFGVITMTAEVLSVARSHPQIGFPRSLFAAPQRSAVARRPPGFPITDSVSVLCGWPPSLSAFKNLKPWQEFIRPPERLFDADLRLLPVRHRQPLPPLRDDVLPWGAHAQIARARAGEADVRWNSFHILFCPTENASFLGRHEREDLYTKIDWLTLEPVEPPEFIRRSENGEFHMVAPDLPDLSPFFGDLPLSNRLTVRHVVPILSNGTDATPRNFRRLFEARFDVAYSAAAQALRQSHPARGYGLLDLLEHAYTRSTILRRVFHHFIDTSPTTGTIPVSIDCGASPMTTVSPASKGAVAVVDAITLPAARDDASACYQSVRGLEPPAIMRMILHEFIHAWTRLPDPAVPDQRHHRGAVVWLTEATLRQMGHLVHPRIAYGVWDKHVAMTSASYQNTILWSGLEDRLIEQIVPDLNLSDSLAAYGTQVEHRVTVSQVRSLLAPAAAHAVANDTASTTTTAPPFDSPFTTQFSTRFTLVDAIPGTTPGQQRQFGKDVRAFIRHCETHSPLLRRLHAATHFNVTGEWQFRRENMPSARDEDVQQLYEIDFFRQQVTVLSGVAHYFSHGGPHPFTQEMRILDAVVALLAGEMGAARQASRYLDRGAVVWLTDHILDESGYDAPRRLNRAVLFDTYGTHYRNALNEFARARWAAEVEDRYIASTLIDP